jgi:DNA-binding transcriptional LysR family regulator
VEIRHFLTFRAVLREGSFLKAARALGLAQPTVTLHVQELEEDLGLELFDRRGRKRLLTRAGELFAERALPILEGLDALTESMAEIRDARGGRLHIGSIEPAASERITPILSRLRRERPALRIRLDVSGTEGVSRGVASGEADLGICSAPPAELALKFEPLFSQELVLLVPSRHPLARSASVRASDLEGEPLLVTEQGCAYRGAVEAAFQKRGVQPLWALETGSIETLKAAVRQGLGIALLPRSPSLPSPGSRPQGGVVKTMSDLVIALQVGLATRPGAGPAPPALAMLVETLRQELGDGASEATRSEAQASGRSRARGPRARSA